MDDRDMSPEGLQYVVKLEALPSDLWPYFVTPRVAHLYPSYLQTHIFKEYFSIIPREISQFIIIVAVDAIFEKKGNYLLLRLIVNFSTTDIRPSVTVT